MCRWVPVRWRPLGSPVAQARCPVLVSPRHEVAEVALDDDAAYLSTCSATAGLHDAFYAAKGGIASLTLVQAAGTGAHVALNAAIFQPVPVFRADDGVIHTCYMVASAAYNK